MLLRRLLRRTAIIYLVSTQLVFLAVVGARQAGWLQELELLAYDSFLSVTADGNMGDSVVTLIGATEKDLQTLGWPLSDNVLARVIETLRKHDPVAIGIDIYRDTPIAPGTDRLSRLLRADQRLIWVFRIREDNLPPVRPPQVLLDSDRIGFADVLTDPGGIVRRGLLFMDDGETVYYGFALRLALKYLDGRGITPEADARNPSHIRLGNVTLPPFEKNDGNYIAADARGYQLLLDFRRGRDPFPRYTVADVLLDRIDPSSIKGKVVIVGTTASSVKDYFHTPLSRSSNVEDAIFGISLHAHFVDQLLRSALNDVPAMHFWGEWQETLWLWLFCLVAGVVGLYVRNPILFFICALGGPVSVFIVGAVGVLYHWWIPAVTPAFGWLASATLVTAWISNRDKSDRAELMQLFARHVSADVAEELWRLRDTFLTDGRLEPTEYQATVLFSDIAGFTPVSEHLEPVELMAWLNEYLAVMSKIVMDHGGIVDKFIGDAVMAVFGVPLGGKDPSSVREEAQSAILCAVEMIKKMAELNTTWQQSGAPEIEIRIGIHTGPVVAGSLGSERRMDYTVIGDTVNVAARLEAYGKTVMESTDSVESIVLLSEATKPFVPDEFSLEPVASVTLKGKSEAISIYRLVLEPACLPGSDQT